MELLFRQIDINDAEEIVNLMIDTYRNEPWNEKWDIETAFNKINGFIKNNSAINLCVTDKDNKIIGVLLGYTNYYIDSKEFYVDEFFIGYNYHRKGIGKSFLEYVEKELTQKGHTCMVLLTEKSYPSEYFYVNNDFKTSPNMILMYKNIE
jgi:GNAT superfamily N-acetyltransferase